MRNQSRLVIGGDRSSFRTAGKSLLARAVRRRITPRLVSPRDKDELLDYDLGITNIVARTTAAAAELSDEELRAGAAILRRKVHRYKPRVLAVLGVGAYRTGFGIKTATLGLQNETIGQTKIWILPNPSGLNAHFTPKALGALFLAFNESLKSLD